MRSNSIQSPVGTGEEPEAPNGSISLELMTDLADIAVKRDAFEPVSEFQLCITNTGDTFLDLTNLSCHEMDGDFGDNDYPDPSDFSGEDWLAPGESRYVTYQITPSVVDMESVNFYRVFIANAFVWQKPDGTPVKAGDSRDGAVTGEVYVTSNPVVVLLDWEEPRDNIDGLIVRQTRTNSPENGEYFTVDESISYQIEVTNESGMPFDDLIISQSYKDAWLGGTVKSEQLFQGSLDAGMQKTLDFSHKVTEEDAEAGSFWTQSAAQVFISGDEWDGEGHQAVSDEMTVPTGK